MDKMKLCQFCGRIYEFKGRGIKAFGESKYCSPKCQVDVRRKQVPCECPMCLTKFTTSPSRLADGRGKYCSKKCFAKAHGNVWGTYKGKGLYMDQGGYLKTSDKKFLHVQVAEDLAGVVLQGTERVVHHIDGCKANNNSNNLMILQNNAEHAQIHSRIRLVTAGGKIGVHKICGHCKQVLERAQFYISRSTWDGLFGWCKKCLSSDSKKKWAEKKVIG